MNRGCLWLKRSESIDVFKGIAIHAVILIHTEPFGENSVDSKHYCMEEKPLRVAGPLRLIDHLGEHFYS